MRGDAMPREFIARPITPYSKTAARSKKEDTSLFTLPKNVILLS